MADEIKQKIVLEGEKEYSAALKEANRNLKTLRSELKAETAELGANATAQEKNEAKVRSLRKQIEQQEKVVSTLQTALKEVKDKYGDNAEEVAKWEQKLNTARYSLASMKNALSTTEAELEKTKDAYGDAAEAVTDYSDAASAAEQAANSITLQGAINAAENLTSKMKSAFRVIREVTTSAWDWMKESGSWADELTTNASKWEIDRQTLQGWSYAARFVDTEVETIAKAFQKLNKRTDATDKKLKELGIVAGKSVQAKDLFWEVVEALESIEDVAVRDAAAQDIFGKSYMELLPLIKAGRAEWEKYVKEAEDAGLVLDEDQLNNLTAFDDAWQRMDASVAALKKTLASDLAPAFETIADSLGSLVQSFTEWSKTEEGQAALKGLGDALAEITKSLSSEQNFEGIVNAAAEAIRGLTGALGWINEHQDVVVAGIGAIGLAFAGLTIAKDVMSALLLIKGINWAGFNKARAEGFADTATNGPKPVSDAAKATATSTGSAWWANIMGRVGAAASQITPAMTNAVAMAVDYVMNNTNVGRAVFRGEGTVEEALSETVADLKQNVIDYGDAVKETYENWAKFWDDFWMPKSERDEAEREAAVNGLSLSPDAMAAAQAYWDVFKNGADGGPELDDLINAIPDENVLNVLLDKMENLAFVNDGMEDLPAGWFSDILDAVSWEENGNAGLTSEDVTGFRALPEQIKKSAQAGVAAGMSGINVSMDGYSVGRVVAPYVSQMIGSQMMVNS